MEISYESSVCPISAPADKLAFQCICLGLACSFVRRHIKAWQCEQTVLQLIGVDNHIDWRTELLARSG